MKIEERRMSREGVEGINSDFITDRDNPGRRYEYYNVCSNQCTCHPEGYRTLLSGALVPGDEKNDSGTIPVTHNYCTSTAWECVQWKVQWKGRKMANCDGTNKRYRGCCNTGPSDQIRVSRVNTIPYSAELRSQRKLSNPHQRWLK